MVVRACFKCKVVSPKDSFLQLMFAMHKESAVLLWKLSVFVYRFTNSKIWPFDFGSERDQLLDVRQSIMLSCTGTDILKKSRVYFVIH